ncbi:MAG: hypothetical protein GX352_08360 [Clostridiales bacterium]|nr:hypothetical protein [Clostridiales bacterium]
MKKVLFKCAIVMLICICISILVCNTGRRISATGDNKVDLGQCFVASNFQWMQANIHAWAQIDSKTDIEDLPDSIIKHFTSIKDKTIKIKGKDNSVRLILWEDDHSDLEYKITVTYKPDTYLIINVINTISYADTDVILNRIEEIFHTIDARPNIFITHRGATIGELRKAERESVGRGLVESLGGKDTQIMEDERLISIAGFSPHLGTDPMDGINFRLASRYNSSEDKTYLWVGTPIITIEY